MALETQGVPAANLEALQSIVDTAQDAADFALEVHQLFQADLNGIFASGPAIVSSGIAGMTAGAAAEAADVLAVRRIISGSPQPRQITVGQIGAFVSGVATGAGGWPASRVRSVGTGTQNQLFNLGSAAGTQSSEITSWLYAPLRQFGKMTAPANGIAAPVNIVVQDETDYRSGLNVGSAFGIAHTVTTAADGPKAAIQSSILVNGTGVAPSGTYVSHVSQLAAAAAVPILTGATGGAFVSDPNEVYRGGLFGGNDHPRLGAGALHWFRITGREINAAIEAGASAYQRIGLSIVTGSNAASHAMAICIANGNTGSLPWKHGLAFGVESASWAFDASSVLIGAVKRAYPSAEANINAAYASTSARSRSRRRRSHRPASRSARPARSPPQRSRRRAPSRRRRSRRRRSRRRRSRRRR